MTLYKGCHLHMIRGDGTLETGGYIEYEVLEVTSVDSEGNHFVKLKVIK